MVLLHVLRSVRCICKGYAMRFFFSPCKTVDTKILTTRQFIGWSKADFLQHLNNAKYIEAFEFARWEILASSGFNERAIRGKIYPIVATTQCNYYRQVKPFQIVTIQSSIIGMTAKGRQMVFVQHMYDSKKRLCATALFHCALADWKTGKTVSIREAAQRMDSRVEDFLLFGDLELNNPAELMESVTIDEKTGEKITKPNSFLEMIEEISKNAETYDLSGFEAKNEEHNLVHSKALFATVMAAARITQASNPQRVWWRIGSAPAPEGKSREKK